MYCTNCGTRNDDDARFCERCGTPLAAPGPPAAGPPAAAPGPRRASQRAWWYPIGVWLILSAFFLFLDLATSRSVTWAYWPIGVLGIFLVGFTLLRRLEERVPARDRR